jgi:ribosome-binding protein aMBF1 (putative translation factor)
MAAMGIKLEATLPSGERIELIDAGGMHRSVRSTKAARIKMFDVATMRTNDDLIEAELRTEPPFGAEWKRTALGRAVATALVSHRADRDLSQRDLAEHLRMTVGQVGRLEAGDSNRR